jgi:hypothetical protein
MLGFLIISVSWNPASNVNVPTRLSNGIRQNDVLQHRDVHKAIRPGWAGSRNVASILDQLNILVLAGMALGTMPRGQLSKASLAG